MKHMGTVPLETERIILRRITIDDAPAMFQNWANDPEVTKFLTWPPHGNVEVTRSVISDWISEYAKPSFYQWVMELKATGEIIGTIGVVQQNDRIEMVHIGYCIGKQWWHNGYTSEALAEIVRFFINDVGMNRVESQHDPRNPNSGKVMEKTGMRYEGTLRQADKNNQGGYCDAAYYAILAEDYAAN